MTIRSEATAPAVEPLERLAYHAWRIRRFALRMGEVRARVMWARPLVGPTSWPSPIATQ